MNHTTIKLKPRLRKLFHVIQLSAARYDCVWDCCCDHGYLGMQLLREDVIPKVEFVDCVAHLMTDLQLRLNRFPVHQYRVTCADAGTINLTTDQRHLIILAGIGGELAAVIIEKIRLRHSQQKFDFLLCPNTAQFHLREYLMSNGFHLIEEGFLREKRWNYEILHVSLNANTPINPISSVGQHWRSDNQDHLAYLNKMEKHYRHQSKGCDTGKASNTADMYRNAVISLGG